jgi:hypothetical protein
MDRLRTARYPAKHLRPLSLGARNGSSSPIPVIARKGRRESSRLTAAMLAATLHRRLDARIDEKRGPNTLLLGRSATRAEHLTGAAYQ